ncbi:YceI family protein [Urechidicola croceus]|uniref:Lipid/polyisoprenoid-binding YceI-like domain-containing protein n=1 Tax=Urechidicola croceus TaxID=1850246 RepID=A0A1D8P7L2_9FLAO|nr:YceI family protein [Urechidicola croceus]AOW20550.1 hypothetical protein LPB138_07600 [Urechidicola croceus]
MKKIILAIALVVVAVSCKVDSKNKVETSDAEKVVATEGSTYKVNTEKSSLTWKGFKPTGSHNGTISLANGSLNVADDNIVGGKFTIDMNSIVCLDLPEEGDYGAPKLVGHLNSPDFFDVAKFPTATFEITEVKSTSISGNLTIKGITKNISIPATSGVANGFATLKSELFKVDRTEFGIEYKSMKLADMVKDKSIDDLIEMSFDVIVQK